MTIAPTTLASIFMVLTLAACGRADQDPAAGGLTVGEADRLEAAAERLDARAPSPVAAESAALEAEIAARIDQEKAAITER